jgi:hypothetical protein
MMLAQLVGIGALLGLARADYLKPPPPPVNLTVVNYTHEGAALQGYLSVPAYATTILPAVIVVPYVIMHTHDVVHNC